ncbi:MAG: hypothetical protein JNN29_14990 [Chitinophagaceae bacterium]|nr:hypothetical protein [Chitinophagaceae bacterium]
MRILTAILFFFLLSGQTQAQVSVLTLKKKNKTIRQYWPGTEIAFQLSNKEWRKGLIKKITNDSLFIQPVIVRYFLMGTDTLRYLTTGYAHSDIYAFPKPGISIEYNDGRFQIRRSAGHVHFYWIKGGWLFRTGGMGYIGLHLLNSIGATINPASLAIAGGVVGIGFLLKALYTPVIRLGKKYKLQYISTAKLMNLQKRTDDDSQLQLFRLQKTLSYP